MYCYEIGKRIIILLTFVKKTPKNAKKHTKFGRTKTKGV
ncbi:hypothetical protein [Campylobacter showae]|nr:hypothetical protein [Campylobacter showae]